MVLLNLLEIGGVIYVILPLSWQELQRGYKLHLCFLRFKINMHPTMVMTCFLINQKSTKKRKRKRKAKKSRDIKGSVPCLA